MNSLRKIAWRPRLVLAGLLAALVGGPLIVPAGSVAADLDDLPGLLVRIEEDWELVVKEPKRDVAAPQVSTQMARRPDAPRFCNFHLNSCDVPTYSQGGLQLQVWQGNTNLNVLTSDLRDILNTPDEKITWTQYLRRDGNNLWFGISKADSQTWGDFSGVELTVTGGRQNLDLYSVDYSVRNSGITYGANRVKSLKLLKVRRYSVTGDPVEDATGWEIFPGRTTTTTTGGPN